MKNSMLVISIFASFSVFANGPSPVDTSLSKGNLDVSIKAVNCVVSLSEDEQTIMTLMQSTRIDNNDGIKEKFEALKSEQQKALNSLPTRFSSGSVGGEVLDGAKVTQVQKTALVEFLRGVLDPCTHIQLVK